MPTGSPKILIVSAALPALESTFRRRGFAPQVAATVAAALDLLAREPFDLILLHPVRPLMDGLQLLERKGITMNSTTPVYLLVSREQDELAEHARRLGVWRCAVMQDTSPRHLAEELWRDLSVVVE